MGDLSPIIDYCGALVSHGSKVNIGSVDPGDLMLTRGMPARYWRSGTPVDWPLGTAAMGSQCIVSPSS